MAIGVLNIFDATTDDLINGVILLRKIPFYNLDSLQMAVIADCKTFISLIRQGPIFFNIARSGALCACS